MLLIEKILKEREISQAKLARMSDVNESSMSRIVHGREPAFPNRGMRIAEALGYDPSRWYELFVDEDAETPEQASEANVTMHMIAGCLRLLDARLSSIEARLEQLEAGD